jgi:hypothetical protein
MIAIRIPKAKRAKAWRAMIDVAPIRLVSMEPVYEVLPAHLELLSARGIPFEVVGPRSIRRKVSVVPRPIKI